MLPHVLPLSFDDMSPEAQKAYESEYALRGPVTNMKRTLLHSLTAYRVYMGFYDLAQKVSDTIGKTGQWLFCHSIAVGNQCAVCSTYFGYLLKQNGINPSEYKPSDTEALLMELGRQLSRDNETARVTSDVWQKLKKNYSDEQIVDLIALGSQMVAANQFNDVLEVDVANNIHEEAIAR